MLDKVGRGVSLTVGGWRIGGGVGGGMWDLLGLLMLSLLLSTPCSCALPERASPEKKTNRLWCNNNFLPCCQHFADICFLLPLTFLLFDLCCDSLLNFSFLPPALLSPTHIILYLHPSEHKIVSLSTFSSLFFNRGPASVPANVTFLEIMFLLSHC